MVVVHHVPLDDDVKHKLIKDHGTCVTLIGNKEEDDTMDCDTYGLKGTRESWIQLYLNRRFYSFPKNIDIKTRNGYYKPRDDSRHNYLANIKGYKQSTLDNHALKSGEVNLSDAVVNWHILKEDRDGHGREFVTGHTAVLHEDELFDHSAGVGNKAIGFGLALNYFKLEFFLNG